MEFRVPIQEDLDGVKLAGRILLENKTLWLKENLIPFENIPKGSKTGELLNYGISILGPSFFYHVNYFLR